MFVVDFSVNSRQAVMTFYKLYGYNDDGGDGDDDYDDSFIHLLVFYTTLHGKNIFSTKHLFNLGRKQDTSNTANIIQLIIQGIVGDAFE